MLPSQIPPFYTSFMEYDGIFSGKGAVGFIPYKAMELYCCIFDTNQNTGSCKKQFWTDSWFSNGCTRYPLYYFAYKGAVRICMSPSENYPNYSRFLEQKECIIAFTCSCTPQIYWRANDAFSIELRICQSNQNMPIKSAFCSLIVWKNGTLQLSRSGRPYISQKYIMCV